MNFAAHHILGKAHLEAPATLATFMKAAPAACVVIDQLQHVGIQLPEVWQDGTDLGLVLGIACQRVVLKVDGG